ncbi:MAG: MFS transporter [Bdellovibrionia bacterium]
MIQKWRVLFSVACGTFMATLDSSIVNIALPTLTKTLHADLLRLKWVILIYLLVITCLLLPLGRLSDHFGRKVMYQLGFFIFILGSTFCAFSPSLAWLVIHRGVQAVGGAMLMANGPAIITTEFAARQRGGALGILGMVVSAGLLSGPGLGGLLIEHLGWRSIFLMNVPVGMLGIVFVHYFVKKDEKRPDTFAFDWLGAWIQAVVLLLCTLVFDRHLISLAQVSYSVLALLLVFFSGLLIWVERRAQMPLLDLSLLKDPTFWSANLASFLTFVAFSSVNILMPFFLEGVLHFTPSKAALFMTAIPVTIFVVAPLSGRLSDRVGSQGLSFFGALIGGLGLFSMAGAFGRGMDQSTQSLVILLELASIGLATGLFQSPNNSAIMGAVPLKKLGVASAMLATVRNLGLVFGTGLSTSLFTWRQQSSGDFILSFHMTLFFAGLVAMGATLASLTKRSAPQGVIKTHDLEA